jgi:succinate dehydrogenase hydrophobic anchor subunit
MRRYTYLWLMQIVTGVFIAVLLGIHMVMQHLEDILLFFGVNLNDPTSWQSMIERSRQAVWAGIYIALLAVVLSHALNGLRNVILELTPSPRAERVITGTIMAFGIVVFLWASYVPIALLYS